MRNTEAYFPLEAMEGIRKENQISVLINRTTPISGSSHSYSPVLQHNLKTICKVEEKMYRKIPGSLNSWPEWTEIPVVSNTGGRP